MLDKANLQKAITKGLNKSHGKALAEQVREVMTTIELFEEILGETSPIQYNGSPDSQFGQSANFQWDKEGSATIQGGIITAINSPTPTVLELPSRLGGKKQDAIDGVNFRESQDIMLKLNDLPTEIILNGPEGKQVKAYKMISSGVSSLKADCIELRYVPGGFDNKLLTCARFWTSDPEFDPIKGFNQVHQGMQNFIDTLSKIETIKAATPPPARMPSIEEMQMAKSEEFSRSQLDEFTWTDKNPNISSGVSQLFYQK